MALEIEGFKEWTEELRRGKQDWIYPRYIDWYLCISVGVAEGTSKVGAYMRDF
jgi:hypothetical protein